MPKKPLNSSNYQPFLIGGKEPKPKPSQNPEICSSAGEVQSPDFSKAAETSEQRDAETLAIKNVGLQILSVLRTLDWGTRGADFRFGLGSSMRL